MTSKNRKYFILYNSICFKEANTFVYNDPNTGKEWYNKKGYYYDSVKFQYSSKMNWRKKLISNCEIPIEVSEIESKKLEKHNYRLRHLEKLNLGEFEDLNKEIGYWKKQKPLFENSEGLTKRLKYLESIRGRLIQWFRENDLEIPEILLSEADKNVEKPKSLDKNINEEVRILIKYMEEKGPQNLKLKELEKYSKKENFPRSASTWSRRLQDGTFFAEITKQLKSKKKIAVDKNNQSKIDLYDYWLVEISRRFKEKHKKNEDDVYDKDGRINRKKKISDLPAEDELQADYLDQISKDS